MNKKLLIRMAVFLAVAVVFVLVFIRVDGLLSVKSEHGIDQMRCFYEQPRNSIDVLFLGSSHIHCNVNTEVLWDEYGVPAYDLSGAEQTLWETYHVLIEALKYQKPKLVVLDCYAPIAFQNVYHYDFIDENILGMRFSLNKLEMVAVSVERDYIGDYFPNWMEYHNRYYILDENDREEEDMTREEKQAFKGFTPYFEVRPQQEHFPEGPAADIILGKTEHYLDKIINLCREEGIPIRLILAPYTLEDYQIPYIGRMEELADMHGVSFRDFNNSADLADIGLVLTEDYNDDSHLNYSGSVKFTRYLMENILNEEAYGLTDRRKEENRELYESWDRHVENIREQAKKNGFL